MPLPRIHRVDDGLLVDGHVDGLADAHVVEGLLRGLIGEIADVQAGLLEDLDVRVLLHGLEVGRVRIRHHVAFALLELRPADRGVRRDREDEVVDLGLAAPVFRERLVADDRVLLVLHQRRTDRVPIGSWSIFSGVPAFSMASAYSFDWTPAHCMARFGEERRLRLVERDLDRVVVDLLDRLQQLGHAHVAEIGVVRARHLEERDCLPSTDART